jgi:hypothetical protein
MEKVSATRKALVVTGLILSFFGLCWLLSLSVRPDGFVSRLGFVSAVLSVLGGLICCWAMTFAYFAQKLGWSPRTCSFAGLVFLIPAGYFWVSNDPRSMSICALLLGPASLTGVACRRLAYPLLSDEEFSAPQPPPTLFPK